jgi:alpha-tubulin suppressor-like RCC1 family protein
VQPIELNFGGQVHAFAANYFGGTGNDLVLQWANTRMVSWGYNRQGQLGHEDKGATASPITTPAAAASSAIYGKTVFAAHVGEDVSLVACSDGSLFSWGRFQLLGLNLTTYKEGLPYPVDTTGVLNGKTIIGISVIAISTGRAHTLALCSDNTLVAWGSNTSGELGNNNTIDSPVPMLVNRSGLLAGKTITAIAAGGNHSMALCSDGTLASWGSNYSGQLGNGTTQPSAIPIELNQSGILAGKSVTAIRAGGDHGMALCTDGSVAAWGWNAFGQLGDGSTTSRLSPVAIDRGGVLAGKSIVSLNAGNEHSLALCSDGSLAAWGSNRDGMVNLIESAFGLNPAAPDATPLPTWQSDGKFFTLEFTEPTGIATVDELRAA